MIEYSFESLMEYAAAADAAARAAYVATTAADAVAYADEAHKASIEARFMAERVAEEARESGLPLDAARAAAAWGAYEYAVRCERAAHEYAARAA